MQFPVGVTLGGCEEIKRMPEREAIRMRPGMYIGGTDSKALHHMVEEVLDNALDYALAGQCSRIDITLRDGNEICIQDYGPGISIEPIADDEISVLEVIFNHPNFSQVRLGPGPYHVTGGMHGAGLLVINALSEWMLVKNCRDGYEWQLMFKSGVQEGPLQQVRALEAQESSGTSITFKPDFTILAKNDFDFEVIARRSRDLACLIPDLTINLRDERILPVREETCAAPDGVVSLVRELAQSAGPLHSPVEADLQMKVSWTESGYTAGYSAILRFAFVFTRMESPVVQGFVNAIRTLNVGTHLDGFRDGIVGFLNQMNEDRSSGPTSWQDVEAHLVAAISLLHPAPQFASVASIELLNPEIAEPISNAVFDTFARFAASHPSEMQAILEIVRSDQQ